MASYAGPAPWAAYKAVEGNTGIKRSLTKGGMQWTLSDGWHFKRNKNSGKGFRVGNIHGYNGETKKVRMYDDYVGFHANENQNDPKYQERLAYAEYAFNSTPKDNVRSVDGCGHIAKVEYALKEQILRVTFTNDGSVALFFRVPTAVGGTLFRMAETKQTSGKYYPDGKPKHMLGVMFWDYVRIRGSQHGAKYPWEYEHKGTGKIVNSKNRHVMRLTAKKALAIMEDDNPVSKRLKAQGMQLKPNDYVTVVLNDAEYEKLGDDVNKLLVEQARNDTYLDKQSKLAPQGVDKAGNVKLEEVDEHSGDAYGAVEDEVAREQMLSAVARFKKRGVSVSDMPQELQDFLKEEQARVRRAAQDSVNEAPGMDSSRFGEFLAQAEAKLQKDIENYRYGPEYLLSRSLIEKSIKKSWAKQGKEIKDNVLMDKAVYELIKSLDKNNLGKLIRLRGTSWTKELPEQLQLIGARDYDSAKAYIKAAFGEGAIQQWVKSNLPAKYAMHYVGRFWTKQELKDFANPSLPNSIALKDAVDYKRFIDARDWQGALNLLKTRRTDLIYEDKYGNKKVLRNEPYASQYDQVAEED